MRLLIGAGGTGGGVYPALAVHKALAEQCSNLETLWVGSEGGMEADLVKRAGLPFRAIPAAGVHGVGLLRLPVNLLKLARGLVAARRLLRHFRPDVLFFTGGYVAVPIALAGRSIPKLLYVPDIEPGLALKTLARFADHIAVTVEESRAYFHHKPLTVSGYPTRPELGTWSRETARRHLRLRFDRPVLLVFGGSKGARALNRAILAHLSDLLEQTQVVHISGMLDWPEVEAKAQAISLIPITIPSPTCTKKWALL
ncbi:MAG: UDP-N-acetylglucosamine--N-acetylmuramyl-(pentapeptide) pyrophosphoryl-undecaprenol N-acetylglucosamine transferase [Anaerolineales bacterium]|nr:UDP-N-acetylglucosamine--N-acetylmuramyl-(pentapeptide) pyrophosphoryl-undecaprenol N-acetylglucosamine transferase [Anaerolineales bacterium]